MPPEQAAPFLQKIRQNAYFSAFSHFWLATPQLVLQADWQEVWHSPQPPCFALSHRLRVSRVLILSMIHTPFSLNLAFLPLEAPASYNTNSDLIIVKILAHHEQKVKGLRLSSLLPFVLMVQTPLISPVLEI